jgi:hypothetical protein
MEKGSDQDTSSQSREIPQISQVDKLKSSNTSTVSTVRDSLMVRNKDLKQEGTNKEPTEKDERGFGNEEERKASQDKSLARSKSDTGQKGQSTASEESKIGKPGIRSGRKSVELKPGSDIGETAKCTASVSANIAPVSKESNPSSLKERVQFKAAQKASEVSEEKSVRSEKFEEESKEHGQFSDSDLRVQGSELQSPMESQLPQGDGESSPDLEIRSLLSQPDSIKNIVSESPLLMQEQKQIAEIQDVPTTLSAVMEFQDESFNALSSKKESPAESPDYEPRVRFETESSGDYLKPKQKFDKTPHKPEVVSRKKSGGLDEGMKRSSSKTNLRITTEPEEVNTEANRATPEIRTPKSRPPIPPTKSEAKHDYYDRSGYDINIPPGLSGSNTPHHLIEGLRIESPNKSLLETPFINTSNTDHDLSESIQRQNNMFSAQIQAFHNELDTQQIYNTELQMKSNNLDREQNMITKNILNVELDIKQMKSDNRILENELKRHEHTNKVYELEYKEHQNGIQELSRKLDEIKLRVYKLEEDRKAFREEKNGLELKLVTKQEEVAKLEQDLDCKKRNSEKERSDNSSLTQELVRKKKQLEEQRKKLNTGLEKTKLDYEDQLQKQERSFIETLNNQKHQQREKLFMLKSKAIELESQLNQKNHTEYKLKDRLERLEDKQNYLKELKLKIKTQKEINEDNTFTQRALEQKHKFSFLQFGFFVMLIWVCLLISKLLLLELIELR